MECVSFHSTIWLWLHTTDKERQRNAIGKEEKFNLAENYVVNRE